MEAGEFEVTVYNAGKIDSSILSRAQTNAGRVFRKAGIELSWADGKPTAAQHMQSPHCCPDGLPARISLTVMPKWMLSAQSLSNDAFGVLCLTGVFVFSDQAGKFAQWYRLSESDILGMVISHELGHSLLGAGHSRVGLMAAHLDEDQVLLFAEGRLGFTREQASFMRSHLREITKAEKRENRMGSVDDRAEGRHLWLQPSGSSR